MICDNCIHKDICAMFDCLAVVKESPCSFFEDKNLIVKLPCKIGDTLYWFDKYEKVPSIYKHTVSDITIHEDGITVRCEAIPTTYYFSTIHFGKIAFLTREEAKTELEKFLKERVHK